ncbi:MULTISPECIES: acyl carrier protein [unclassified Kitasatospora]|uniref:acyl carrier protein n=1 Tax=unclassified Kitasatospora TaxID=2633591 RepID=UPI002E33FAEF|nr:acyl carrier protein [Kitasatospora sp. NBC_01246]
MTEPVLPDRAEVLTILAAFGQRAADTVPEELGSLELTWLIAEFEQRYGIEPDLDDERFEAIRTVDDAVEVLRSAVLAAAAGAPPERTAGVAQS